MDPPDLRLVVLDRDGVINRESPAFIKSPDEWVPLEGSIEAIASLARAGFTVVVATNQSGVGRGLIAPATLDAIHGRMRQAIEAAGGQLGGIYVCPHHPDAGCDCRKPRAGLLRRIAHDYGISLEGTPQVGDSLRDLEAARAVGARPLLVRTGNGRETERTLPPGYPVEIFPDLAQVAAALLRG